jgi:hypothetical protein
LHNQPFLWRAADEFLTARALDRSLRALDANHMSGTIWNYSADNTKEIQDSFNGEDLSIFSRSDQKDASDINSGGRALASLVRPYPRAVAGEILHWHYDWLTRAFKFEFRHDPNIDAPTEIFLPRYIYPHGIDLQLSDGDAQVNQAAQWIKYFPDRAHATHQITFKPSEGTLVKEQIQRISGKTENIG